MGLHEQLPKLILIANFLNMNKNQNNTSIMNFFGSAVLIYNKYTYY